MDVILEALSMLFQPLQLLFMVLGCAGGLVLGAIPGLSGGLAMVILLPLTYSMTKYMALASLISIYVGGLSGAFIGSILLGIPGTSGSLATTYDGYPLTQKGESGRALSVAMVCNFLGTVPSFIIAMFASSIISKFAVKLGPFEYFAMCSLAISLVASLSKGRLIKGFMAAGIGLFISCIGTAPISATERFTFGNRYLFGGFDTVAILTGIMAMSMIVIDFAKKEKGVSGVTMNAGKFQWPGKDLSNNFANIIRSFLLGLGIGFLPGMGGGVSNVASYAIAKSASKHPDEFGKGCIDGVIAPEVANNASQGGAIIPMISLGIPGDGSTTLLISALTIQGLEIGPLLSVNEPVLTKMIFLAGMIAGCIALLVNILAMPVYPKILQVPYHYLYPIVIVLCMIGAYISTFNIFNLFVVILFMIVGIWFRFAGMPSAPFFLAYILGYMLEANLRKGISYSENGFMGLFSHPVAMIMVVVTFILIAVAVVQGVRDYLQKTRS